MDFHLDKPIWLQLADEFSRRIMTGQWLPGQQIPSVRKLAVEMEVNPNTVQKTLTELERLGILYSVRTAGRFVTEEEEKITQLQQQQSEQIFYAFINQIRGIGFNLSACQQRLTELWPDSGDKSLPPKTGPIPKTQPESST